MATGAADRDVELGQLAPRQLGRRVDRRPRLAHHDVRHGQPLADRLGHQRLRLAGGGAVTDGHHPGAVPRDELLEGAFRLGPALLRLVGIDGGALQVAARLVHHRHLAAGAKAGVDGQHAQPAQRRLQEELTQVGAEHADGVGLRLLGAGGAHLALDGRAHEPVIAVGHRRQQLAAKDGFGPAEDPRSAPPTPGGVTSSVSMATCSTPSRSPGSRQHRWDAWPQALAYS